ncbi:protein NDL1-like [Pistacia vera]|uniref:protein NDL1-like n=1 Tax=Pistacia vera TaxID=55513 RepID=UPI0012639262|nr:protein NDL1-like [Pistacia vera]
MAESVTRMLVKTSKGSVSVLYVVSREACFGNYPGCSQLHVLFPRSVLLPDAASLWLHNFCIYHIDAPGHEELMRFSSDVPLLSVDDLAEQLQRCSIFWTEKVLCLGVTAGAYPYTLCNEIKSGCLINTCLPFCKAPSWAECLYHKVLMNLLYFYGMCGVLKECEHGEESDIIQACRRVLDQGQSLNVMRFLQAINERHDLTDGLQNLQCKMLIFVGESSPFHAESVFMSAAMGKKSCALVEVQACGSLVTEEYPLAMLIPIEFFLMGFGYYRQPHFASSSSNGSNPTSPSNHSCIAPELLSPESLGIKLKPIKTRADIEI